MNNTFLLASIAKHITLNADEQAFFVSLLQYKKIKRKQFLLDEGAINTKLPFVTSGCLRSYAIDKNGFEHVLQFAPPGWWIGDIHSFLTVQPSRLAIDAIEDTEVTYMMKADFENLLQAAPVFERFFRVLALNSLATYQYRQIDTLSLAAADRYKNFCSLYPSLVLSLPQKQIASYIGVTPEFFSKMINTTLMK